MDTVRWRARIDTTEGRTLGAGLLVASTRILTCAHVVHGMAQVYVAFPGVADQLPAEVVWSGDWKQVGDCGDVAVLELGAPAPVEVCEFAPMLALQPRSGETSYELRALGFPPAFDKDGTHVTLHTSSDRVLRQEWFQIEVGQEHLQRLNEGFSGAGAYIPGSGKVAGMVTDAVLDDDDGGFIGRMLPLDTIRRYWETLDDLLPLDWLDPEPRRQLRAIADGIVPTAGLEIIFRRAFPTFLHPPQDFRSVWDAIRFVGERVAGEDRLRLFLVTLATYLEHDVRHNLVSWIGHWLPLGNMDVQRVPPPCNSIIIRAEPLTRGQSLELTSYSLVEGVTTSHVGPFRVRRDQLRAKVESALAELVSQVHDVDWMIEFLLPEGLMNEPFDDWQIQEPGALRPVPVRSVPVVIRHVDRLKPMTVSHRTRKRWTTLRTRGLIQPQPVSCNLKYGYDEFHDWLDAAEELCALVYAAIPRPDWLSAALDTGIPIMLWRRQDCGDGHAHCASGEFLTQLTTALATADPDQLPVEVMKLRKAAKSPVTGGDQHCGNRLTLFWDDPERSPDPPLMMGGP